LEKHNREKRRQIVKEEEGVATRMISTQERRTKKKGLEREGGKGKKGD